MADPEVRKNFEFFKLGPLATLSDLDKKYNDLTVEIQKRKYSEPAVAQKLEEEVEAAYVVLLHHFIRMDNTIKRGRPPQYLSYDSVANRRYEAGPYRAGSDLTPHNMQPQHSTEELMYENTCMSNPDEDNDDNDEDVVVLGNRRYQYRELRPRPPSSQIFAVVDWQGDIPDIPDNAIIVHAVNCLGVWGSGFAAQLKLLFPAAYVEYQTYCHSVDIQGLLVGNCLLIPPQVGDYAIRGKLQPKRWIACLFTSVGYGRGSIEGPNPGRDEAETIKMNTDSALVGLRNEIAKYDQTASDKKPGDIYSPRFNSGHFGVPWSETERIIAVTFAGYPGTWTVIVKPEEE